jgi:serine/threonine-protein kinase SRK2
LNARYSHEALAHTSDACRDFLSLIFVPDPEHRITIAAMKAHPWFLADLPPALQVSLPLSPC